VLVDKPLFVVVCLVVVSAAKYKTKCLPLVVAASSSVPYSSSTSSGPRESKELQVASCKSTQA